MHAYGPQLQVAGCVEVSAGPARGRAGLQPAPGMPAAILWSCSARTWLTTEPCCTCLRLQTCNVLGANMCVHNTLDFNPAAHMPCGCAPLFYHRGNVADKLRVIWLLLLGGPTTPVVSIRQPPSSLDKFILVLITECSTSVKCGY